MHKELSGDYSGRNDWLPPVGGASDFTRSVVSAFGAVALIGLSLYSWRIALVYSDWATLLLLPLVGMCYYGIRPILLDAWRAKRRVWLREESPLAKWWTGSIRATVLAVLFTLIALFVLAWQAVKVDGITAGLLVLAAFISGGVFSGGKEWFAQHCHEPFARTFATATVSWLVALPFTLVLTAATYYWVPYTDVMLNATFYEALQIGIDELPRKNGWVYWLLVIPCVFDAAKLWVVVQLANHPGYSYVAVLFCLDAALVIFVTCHVSVVVTQLVERINYSR